ncbi:MAG: thiamine diphosphokinase [Bacteroidetes bacterium]|nr:thiamine diphosphokinase [Bacteroidota bacterium]
MLTLLLCNGAAPSRTLARKLARIADRLVVADGGANAALSLGLTPDIIIGDLDSIASASRRAFAAVRTLRVRRQDNTDMEKALDHIRAAGGGEVVVLGATGGRIDMTLANLSVVWRYIPALNIVFADNGWFAVPLRGSHTFTARAGSRVSLIPFGTCSGITLRGLRFPLTDARLGVGEVAVSNVVRSGRFSVTVKRGRMIVVVFDAWHRSSR